MSTENRPDASPRVPTSGEIESYPPTRLPNASSSSLRVHSLFAGRYRIVKELGRGGMGIVMQARDTRLPRDVAIKVPIHLDDPESLRRFRNEAEAAAMIEHPNICRVLDLGESGGLPFIVLSFVRGRTLADVIRGRTLDPDRASRLIRSVARTVAFAHEGGIAHRDLKPANLMIGPYPEPIVMDFGLARLIDQERGTRTGQVFGTLPYMSPEQVQGQAGRMGKSCDIYTLGVIFYELLTGRLPFQGPVWDVARQIVVANPSPPSSIRRRIDPELDAIILRAMSKKIEGRFGSMREFASSIEDHLRRDVPSPSRPPAPLALRPGGIRHATGSGLTIRLRPEPLRGPRRRAEVAPVGIACCAAGLLAMLSSFVTPLERRNEPMASPRSAALTSTPQSERASIIQPAPEITRVEQGPNWRPSRYPPRHTGGKTAESWDHVPEEDHPRRSEGRHRGDDDGRRRHFPGKCGGPGAIQTRR